MPIVYHIRQKNARAFFREWTWRESAPLLQNPVVYAILNYIHFIEVTDMNKPSLLVFGEIIWDLYPDKSCIGGAPLNFAVHFVRAGGSAALLSAVGADDLGRSAVDFLERNGVDTRFIQRVEYPTGRCEVTLNGGIPSYFVVPDVAYDHILPTRAEGYDLLCFGTLAQRGESRACLKRLLKEGKFRHIFCDVNLRPDCYDRESVENCLANATLLKISDEEEPLLREVAGYLPAEESAACDPMDAPDALFARYGQLEAIVLTQGERGATLYRRGRAPIHVPAAPAEVVSTVGAGDSFGAAWLYHTLMGADDLTALTAASARAAWVIAHAEAIPEEPPLAGRCPTPHWGTF